MPHATPKGLRIHQPRQRNVKHNAEVFLDFLSPSRKRMLDHIFPLDAEWTVNPTAEDFPELPLWLTGDDSFWQAVMAERVKRSPAGIEKARKKARKTAEDLERWGRRIGRRNGGRRNRNTSRPRQPTRPAKGLAFHGRTRAIWKTAFWNDLGEEGPHGRWWASDAAVLISPRVPRPRSPRWHEYEDTAGLARILALADPSGAPHEGHFLPRYAKVLAAGDPRYGKLVHPYGSSFVPGEDLLLSPAFVWRNGEVVAVVMPARWAGQRSRVFGTPEETLFAGKRLGQIIHFLEESPHGPRVDPEDWAFTPTISEEDPRGGIGVTIANQRGYYRYPRDILPTPAFASYSEASAYADELNDLRGMSKDRAFKIVGSSMFPGPGSRANRRRIEMVFVEWLDQNGRYHGANYPKADLPALLRGLEQQGVQTVAVDDEARSTGSATFTTESIVCRGGCRCTIHPDAPDGLCQQCAKLRGDRTDVPPESPYEAGRTAYFSGESLSSFAGGSADRAAWRRGWKAEDALTKSRGGF